jgi:hypothetical protein
MGEAIVCLTAGAEFYSRAIRKLTHSNVNHAFIAYTSREWGGWWAVQIDERGVVKVPVENVEYEYIECYDFPGLDLTTAFPHVRDLIGDKYDWEGIAGFLIKLYAWRVFGRRIVNPLHKTGELFCSEFVTKFLKSVEGMYDWMKVQDAASVAPGGPSRFLGTPSLQELLQNQKGARRISPPFTKTRPRCGGGNVILPV